MQPLQYFRRLDFDTKKSRIPLTILHSLVLLIALFFQYYFKLSLLSALVATLLFTIYSLFHWFSETILEKSDIFYFSFQGIIIAICSFVLPNASPVIVLGLIPTIIVHGMLFYKKGWKFTYFIFGYTLFYLSLMYIHFGVSYLWAFFTVYVLQFLFAIIILHLFNEKDAENVELQYLVKQLQIANNKIEHLTLQNERQRMARDLHDTLAQRLVGLILKLDASEVHLQKGNIEKVNDIIASAKEQAKVSLHDARKVIEDLRDSSVSNLFQLVLEDEIAQLQFLYKMQIELKFEEVYLTDTEKSHLLSIVKEAITNCYKHARATKVEVSISQMNKHIVIQIIDNGVGIDIQEDMQKNGHYGILGMRERVLLMNGQFHIENKNGTHIKITIPQK